ncbi:ArsA family ATPase, partial [bacterium]|nr:ArsA family ATPase [bacterium]
PVGDKITRVATEGHLDALEIDPERHLERLRQEYRESIEAVFNRFVSGGADVKFDREVMRELISLSPPGLDELMALVEATDLSDQYDQLILDMAPTGHLIRFLEMPDLARSWVKAILKILLKYKTVVGLADTAQKIVNVSRDIRRIKGLLTDQERCEFVAVTIPEAMGLAETRRLLRRLDELGTPCRHAVVNMVMPQTGCPFCQRVREQQREYVRQAAELRPGAGRAVEVPLFPHQVSGMKDLRKLAHAVYGRKRPPLTRVAVL